MTHGFSRLIAVLFLTLATFPAVAAPMVHDITVTLGIGARPSLGLGHVMNKSAQPVKLLAVTSPAFETIELHTHTMQDGVMKMRKIEAINVPANGVAKLQRGGLHLMLFGYKHADSLKPVALTFTFDNGDQVETIVTPQKLGSKGQAGHHGH